MTSALDRLPPRARELLRPQEQPEWTAPMLAVLTNERFSDPGWIYERKLDGERCLAFRHGGRLRLLSRTRQRAAQRRRGVLADFAANRCTNLGTVAPVHPAPH